MTAAVRPSTLSEALKAVAGPALVFDDAGREEATLQRVIDRVGGLEMGDAPVAPSSALAFAVVNRRGEVQAADPGFTDLTDSVALTIVDLQRRAERGQPAVGLVETAAGGLAALCCATAAQAAAWPLSAGLRSALRSPAAAVLMQFAPARASDLALQAAAAFGLSELEARIAAALLEAPTLEIAAGQVGVGRETARDALAGAMRKMGVRRTPALVRRLTDMVCGATAMGDGEGLADALSLTPSEAKVARLSGEGATAADVARILGVKPATVKSHLHSAFEKSGVGRAKDFGRFDVQLHALKTLARTREFLPDAAHAEGKLRVIARPDGRRVAFMDYGPPRGRTLLMCHALASGRTLPRQLAEALKTAGFRPVLPQRPGFGLTDPAPDNYLGAVADDMDAVLTAIKRDVAVVFARDIGAAGLLAFAERYPARLGKVVLLNPEREIKAATGRGYALPAAARLLQRNPEITQAFFEVLRRQTATDRLASLLVESFRTGVRSDGLALQDPENLAWLIRDIQAMVARTVSGIVQERLVYARNWRAPTTIAGGRWTIAQCAEVAPLDPEPWWNALPCARFECLAEGGLMLPLTHPDTVVRLLDDQAAGSG